jgi:hypothetical protein
MAPRAKDYRTPRSESDAAHFAAPAPSQQLLLDAAVTKLNYDDAAPIAMPSAG